MEFWKIYGNRHEMTITSKVAFCHGRETCAINKRDTQKLEVAQMSL